ncbi:ABC transporter ATP-binding protein, partial [Halolamina salina]
KLLVGHLTPDSGTVSVGGEDVTDAGHRLREVVGYVPEHAGFPDALTGREVLGYHARLRGVPAAERADRPRLHERRRGRADQRRRRRGA